MKENPDHIISYEKSLPLTNPVYIDVRSPYEYSLDHIPGAVNIPLFENDERKEIGTLYRLSGRDNAVLRGTEIVGGKLSHIVETIQQYQGRNMVIYCARGGMRSASVTSLISSLGMKVARLDRGYKGYRHYVINRLENLTIEPPVIILQGLTGTGKTEILAHIQNSLDLEAMAGHRSSIFGAIGMTPQTQKYFESQLLHHLDRLSDAPCILIEGESQKIGNLHIPDKLFSVMRRSPAVLVTASLQRRANIIVDEYGPGCSEEAILPLVQSLNRRLGKETISTLENLYCAGDLHGFTEILLEKYYDPLYRHSLKHFEYIGEVENLNSEDAAQEVKDIITAYLEESR